MKKKSKNTNYRDGYHSTIFTKVYTSNAWGGNKGEFYSGTGSHNNYIDGYANIVADFVKKNTIVKIVEIGCGDFNVTQHILTILQKQDYNFSYHGYDVVKPLIERNKILFASPNIRFTRKDSSKGNIASGDLLIVRQVLQHLDNQSIKKITDKFNQYKHIIVTEHQLADKFIEKIIPNKNKKTDASNRVMFMSGVYLDKPPYNCKLHARIYSIPEPILGLEAYINTFLISNEEFQKVSL